MKDKVLDAGIGIVRLSRADIDHERILRLRLQRDRAAEGDCIISVRGAIGCRNGLRLFRHHLRLSLQNRNFARKRNLNIFRSLITIKYIQTGRNTGNQYRLGRRKGKAQLPVVRLIASQLAIHREIALRNTIGLVACLSLSKEKFALVFRAPGRKDEVCPKRRAPRGDASRFLILRLRHLNRGGCRLGKGEFQGFDSTCCSCAKPHG